MQICSDSFTFEAAMIDDSFVFLVVVATVVTFEVVISFQKKQTKYKQTMVCSCKHALLAVV